MQRLTCLIDGTPVEFVCQAEILTKGKRYYGTLFTPSPESFEFMTNRLDNLVPDFKHNYRIEVFRAIQDFEEDPLTPSLYL